jgi:RNA polymerase sigma factor (sigma-70 family)
MPPYESLVESAQNGDQPAFAELVIRFQDAAREWAFQMLGDPHLAEDAAQEAFLIAYRQLDQLRDPKAFPAWLKRIVISRSHRILRRRQTAAPLDDETRSPEAERDPASEVEKRELQESLRRAVENLPEGERAVTELFYLIGYSQQEIAEQLQLPLTTVKKRLQYARERLKESMSAQIVARLHLDDEAERFTGTLPMGILPSLVYGYAAAYSPDSEQVLAEEQIALIEFLQEQQLIPVFE